MASRATRRRPLYGGRKGDPDLGANGRRLWAHILENESKKTVVQLQRKIVEATDPEDRFVRYETIIECAQRQGLEHIDRTLVRRLARADRHGSIGRKKSIRFRIAA